MLDLNVQLFVISKHQIPLRWLRYTMWLLGIDLRAD